MNKAQVLIPLGNGRYAWRDGASPVLVNPYTGDRGPCLLAFETARHPTWRCGMLKFRAYSNGVVEQAVGPQQAPRKRRPPSPGLAERMLEVLINAWRANEKLGFSEICERVGVARSKHSSAALGQLCDDGRASREGKNRGMVYFPSEEEKAAP